MTTVSRSIAADLIQNKGQYPGDAPSYALIRYRNKFNGHFSYSIVDCICNFKITVQQLLDNCWSVRSIRCIWRTNDKPPCEFCYDYHPPHCLRGRL